MKRKGRVIYVARTTNLPKGEVLKLYNEVRTPHGDLLQGDQGLPAFTSSTK